MRRFLILPLAAALGFALAGQPAPGQGPGDGFGVLKTNTPGKAPEPAPEPAKGLVPRGVEPVQGHGGQPANPYPTTPAFGEWLICAATYTGADGMELARQVVVDLKAKHKLSASIFNRGDEDRAKQKAEHEARVKQLPPGVQLREKRYRVVDQYAVLIGGFKDFTHASDYLATVRKLPPPTLKLENGKSPYEVMTYPEVDPKTKKETTRTAYVNPFTSALVVRNPALPSAVVSKPKWDPFWKKLNADEPNSLLKNPKPWTLAVKEYTSPRVLHSQKSSNAFLSALGVGSTAAQGAFLDASARQAQELAKFLREPSLGFTTYVMHTRSSSAVCVGGFDGPDDPEMARTSQRLINLSFKPKDGGADPIGLFPVPVPIEVPRP